MSRYGRERQLEIALEATLTTDADASHKLGVPRRTVAAIRARWQHSSEMVTARARLAATFADRYVNAEHLALSRAVTALQDPETPPRDIARILEVVSDRRALLTGDVTARTESTVNTGLPLTWQQQNDLMEWLDKVETASDDELREWLATGGAAAIRDQAKQLEAGKEATDG